MKTLIALLALVSFNAIAATVDVMSIDDSWEISSNSLTIVFNASTDNGNAWVEASTPSSEDSNGVFERARVEGLSLQGDSIVLDVEGQQVQCATLTHRRFFGTRIRNTGNCKFVVKRNSRRIDDGFEGYTKTTWDISLVTP